jgi:hypothetical protein
MTTMLLISYSDRSRYIEIGKSGFRDPKNIPCFWGGDRGMPDIKVRKVRGPKD